MVRRRIASRSLSAVAVVFAIAAFAPHSSARAETPAALENRCTDDNEAPEQRIAACTQLIDTANGLSDEQRARLYGLRANAYAEEQDFNYAIEDYSRAIDGKPDDVIAIANRATAYRYLGQHDLAIEDYDRAIRLDSTNPVLFFNRGGAHSELGNYDRAIEDYSRTIELNPDLPPVHMDRANAYVETAQFARAIEDYTAVIRLVPDYAEAYGNRGNSYSNLRQFDRAISDYNEAIRLEPDNDFIYVNLAYAYQDIGQYKDALASIDTALNLDLDSVRAQGALAWLYATAKDPAYRNGEKALRLAREVVEARREPNYLNILAAAYVEIGDKENAIVSYRDALQLGGAAMVASYQSDLLAKKIYTGPITGNLDRATEAAIRACVTARCKLLAN